MNNQASGLLAWRRVGGIAVAAVVGASSLALLVGCGQGSNGEGLRREAALDVFWDAVDAASEAPEKVCAYAATKGDCERELQYAHDANLSPSGPPEILCEGPVPAAGGNVGGYGLAVAGDNASGASYRTEILVFETSEGIKLVNPVYSTGAELSLGSPGAPQPWECQS
jgi:hypothetical protein